ncbi:antibiotic biosynthesis monooxygenase [Nocardia vinacea]|uniref:Antibiotic biosynthesis monooxygenase n=1 Tax=Nocardia vinacea TaxID=96468 RepID=A0ABZ1Z182_9NOCA|nr:antibiotic biosynthesis monooxygenase [Nocardia vinacea]
MYARSTTIQAQPSAIDAGIAHVRDEVMPAVEDIPGCVGLSLLVDRQSGRCIVTTSWETEDAMNRSADRVRPIRDRAAAAFGGGGTQIEQWEIAVLHRDHRVQQGACARAVWMRTNPDRQDAGIETYKSQALPGMESLEGFCSASLLVERGSGRGVSCVTFDTADAMEHNREEANALRERITRQAGMEVVDMCEFELAIAHLRVPELV